MEMQASGVSWEKLRCKVKNGQLWQSLVMALYAQGHEEH